jgi:hypothetical protein
LHILADVNIKFNQNKKGVFYLEKLINFGDLWDSNEIEALTEKLKKQHRYLNPDLFQTFMIFDDIIKDNGEFEPKVKERMERLQSHVLHNVPKITMIFEYFS